QRVRLGSCSASPARAPTPSLRSGPSVRLAGWLASGRDHLDALAGPRGQLGEDRRLAGCERGHHLKVEVELLKVAAPTAAKPQDHARVVGPVGVEPAVVPLAVELRP